MHEQAHNEGSNSKVCFLCLATLISIDPFILPHQHPLVYFFCCVCIFCLYFLSLPLCPPVFFSFVLISICLPSFSPSLAFYPVLSLRPPIWTDSGCDGWGVRRCLGTVPFWSLPHHVYHRCVKYKYREPCGHAHPSRTLSGPLPPPHSPSVFLSLIRILGSLGPETLGPSDTKLILSDANKSMLRGWMLILINRM